MKLHDWTRVEANTFHDFHTRWIAHLTEVLNRGMLPPEYYAQSEQHISRKIGDVLALHASDPGIARLPPRPKSGALAVLETEPRVGHKQILRSASQRRPRTLTIRHTSGHRIIALIEIISPGNKGSASNVEEFVKKVEEALLAGIHVVVIDVLPPGKHDPAGIQGCVAGSMGNPVEDIPPDRPLGFVSSAVDLFEVVAYREQRAVGEELPEMPLFLISDQYVNLPLAPCYQQTVEGMPPFWREVLEGRDPSPPGA